MENHNRVPGFEGLTLGYRNHSKTFINLSAKPGKSNRTLLEPTGKIVTAEKAALFFLTVFIFFRVTVHEYEVD